MFNISGANEKEKRTERETGGGEKDAPRKHH